jgi:hypothetical protein
MADRYWVGGTGSWNATNLTSWSATSGGAGGASIPTAVDNVYFDANSGGGTVTIAVSTRTCLNLSFRGLSGTSDYTGTLAGTVALNISGGLILSASATYTHSGIVSFLATSGSNNITSNGRALASPIIINGLGGTFNLTDQLTTTAAITLTAGTVNINNGANVTSSTFSSGVANVRTLNLGSSTWTLTNAGNAWNMSAITNLTINAGTSRIVFTNTSATLNTFVGGGFTYYTVEYARGGGGGTLNFTGSNVITNFIDVNSTAAHSITFAATTSIHRFIVRGSPGQLITVGRSATGTPVITKIGRGIVCNCDYLNIVSLGFTASPANTWYAGANSTGSATGWIMTAPPSSQSLLGVGGVG